MRLAVAFGLLAAISEAQPVVSSVQNNYSYLLPGLPNYGIAQGSIFVLFGSNLSAASTGLQTAPLKTNLEYVSVSFTVGGQSRSALLYYVTPTQIAGILPSNTPLGVGTVIVTAGGRSSAAVAVSVVQSAFGILTLDGSGTGAAAVLDASNRLLTQANASHPGEVIVVYGTGAGPTQGEESIAPVQANLAAIPILVEIGGRRAEVLYHGRTIFPGLDQINVVVPVDLIPGYAVTLTVTSTTFVSNFTTIPVAINGPNCPVETEDPELTITSEERKHWITAGRFTTGSAVLLRSLSYSISDFGGSELKTTLRADRLTGNYSLVTGNVGQLLSLNSPAPKPGSCMVTAKLTSTGSNSTNPAPDLLYKALDAGFAIDAIGPGSALSAFRNANNAIGYAEPLSPPGRKIFPGLYTVNGSGGLDIGAFRGSIAVHPELEWINRSTLETIDRGSPVTVTWSGGEPTALVIIEGSGSLIQGNRTLTSSFQCWARNSDGTFTIPSTVLLTTIPSLSGSDTILNTAVTRRGKLGIASENSIRVRPSGLDSGHIESRFVVEQSTRYR